MMILYGIMRFACEILRDNEKILFGISAVAIHAILIFAVGIIWMLILYRYQENNYEDSIQTLEAAEGETLQAGEGTEGAEA
jgi:prolipoprotein diacylglyceryltransferase